MDHSCSETTSFYKSFQPSMQASSISLVNNSSEDARLGSNGLIHTRTRSDLQSLEMERRRIINNQIVRRKKLTNWIFPNHANTSESMQEPWDGMTQSNCLTEEDKLAANVSDVSSPAGVLTSQTNSYSQVDDRLQPSEHFPQVPNLQLLEELKASTMSEFHPKWPSIATSKSSHEECHDKLVPFVGAVDTSSIIENKETTKTYWESRMMAEQALLASAAANSSPATPCTAKNGLSEKIANVTNGGQIEKVPSNKMNGNSSHVLNSDHEGANNVNLEVKAANSVKQSLNGPIVSNGNSYSNTFGNSKLPPRDGKFGSDGESEASPETSPSPASLEESDDRTSSREGSSPPFPSERKIKAMSNGAANEVTSVNPSKSSDVSPLLHLVCDALDQESSVDESMDAKDPFSFDPFSHEAAIEENDFIVHKVLLNDSELFLDESPPNSANLVIHRSSFEEREENLLSTVIEEEQEPDSLEEFSKHELECGCQSASDGTISTKHVSCNDGSHQSTSAAPKAVHDAIECPNDDKHECRNDDDITGGGRLKGQHSKRETFAEFLALETQAAAAEKKEGEIKCNLNGSLRSPGAGDGVEQGPELEPVTSTLKEMKAKRSEPFEVEKKDSMLDGSLAEAREDDVMEGAKREDERGEKKMKNVDNDQRDDSFKIEKDSEKMFLNSKRPEDFTKKVESTSSSQVTTKNAASASTASTAIAASVPFHQFSEQDVVTQLFFEPIESLVQDSPSSGHAATNQQANNMKQQFCDPSSEPANKDPSIATGVTHGSTRNEPLVHHGNTQSDVMSKDNSSPATFFKRSTSIKDLREKQNEAEVKIAREIIELKQREEELRLMRQEMSRIQAMRTKEDIKAVPSDVSSVEIDGRCSPSSSEISTTDSVSGRISVDSLESSNHSSSSDHIHHNFNSHHNKINRLNRSKVRPFEEKCELKECLSEVVGLAKKQESPIEREIRIAKEREEELRLEKLKRSQAAAKVSGGINGSEMVTSSLPSAAVDVSSVPLTTGITSSTASSASCKPLNSSSAEAIVKKSTNVSTIQKVLATTRIQQEIEEQTQREMALRAAGSIKTISHERTDFKVVPTKLSGPVPASVAAALESKPVEKLAVKETPIKLTGSLFEKGVHQLRDEVERKSLAANQLTNLSGNGSLSNDQVDDGSSKTTKTSQFVKNVKAKSLTPASPSSNSPPVNGGVITQLPVVRKSSASPVLAPVNGQKVSISMHKFISSKGKGNPKYKQFGSHQNLSSLGITNETNSSLGNGISYQELRPPMLTRKFDGFPRRGSVSAETKIQEELREMKAREEELRNQRTRSQCSLLDNDDDQKPVSQNEVKTSFSPLEGLKRANSMSALLLSGPDPSGEEDLNECNSEITKSMDPEPEFLPTIGRPRIKTSLIAEWESKIQKAEGNPV